MNCQDLLIELINFCGLTEEQLDDKEKLTQYYSKLLILLEKHKLQGINYSAEIVQDESDVPVIKMTRQVHGLDHDYLLGREFFTSSDYRLLANLGDKLDALLGEKAYIQRGDKQQEVSRFSEVMDWLMEQARKGLSIQRYKGLGEMNPDQLWDTTMNPETRRMLQVQIEDAVAADEVFTTLMGDQVEPRREFIEKNALTASNIDT